VEHDEAVEVAAFDVERADGKRRACVAAGHEDHAATRGQERHGEIEVRFAQRFPPDVNAARSKLFDALGDGIGLVVDGCIGAERACGGDFLLDERRVF
jgi:hypothetical protein